MNMPKFTFLGWITENAKMSYGEFNFVAADYDKWVAHWFATAEQLKQNALAEGLVLTAEAIEKEIVMQRRLT